jgi:hypothetical protein
VEEIVYFEAADKYVRVVTTEHEVLIRTPLKELLPQLDSSVFWRVHRGTVVRAVAIDSVLRDEAGKLSLALKGRPEKLPVSRLYAHLFAAVDLVAPARKPPVHPHGAGLDPALQPGAGVLGQGTRKRLIQPQAGQDRLNLKIVRTELHRGARGRSRCWQIRYTSPPLREGHLPQAGRRPQSMRQNSTKGLLIK